MGTSMNMTPIRRPQSRFTGVPDCLPVTQGFWFGDRGDEWAYLEHRESWIAENLSSQRLQRLFAVQCAMRTIDASNDERYWLTIQTAAWYAELGKPTPEDNTRLDAALRLLDLDTAVERETAVAAASRLAVSSTASWVARDAAASAAGWSAESALRPERDHERQCQSRLLTLFLSLKDWDNSWVTDRTAGMARKIYDDQQWDLLCFLSDPLQDAGCNHPWLIEFLQDSRTPTLGCRGWWFIDRLRGFLTADCAI